MNRDLFEITFPNASAAEANRLARSLADELMRDVAGLNSAEPRREREDTQDFGATLVLLLGTAAAGAVAKGIKAWLTRTGTSAELRKDGTISLSNLDSKDVAEIAKAFAGH